ncbi:glycosyltransferase family 2 protein [Halorubrum salsamenti]|uniref:glycosyltransferase family 2 protein n=1 Tax=Halorubrum salsamenti TaxID=2583990 RepID=UPI0011A60E79|nr:glycosyltransferase family 2 protein [Halorubrum salsamenti]
MASTGIAVFAYNRPNHLSRVLSGLQQNNIDHLYIFVDGPTDERDKEQVADVRKRAEQVDWCRTTVTTHNHNIGLADSIVSGIERVFEDHQRIIVLEDDCVPASNFVSFMKNSLEEYADDKQVMNVNGYSPPINIPGNYPYDIYFTYRSASWGWGTWRSAWDHFEQDPMTLEELKTKKNEIKRVTRDAGEDLYPMIRDQLKGNIDSWAVWWSYAIAANNGLCLNPVTSKIKNIGHDGTGTHTGKSDKFNVDLDTRPISELNFPQQPFINEEINSRYNQFIGSKDQSRLKLYCINLLKSMGLLNKYNRLRK